MNIPPSVQQLVVLPSQVPESPKVTKHWKEYTIGVNTQITLSVTVLYLCVLY